MNLHKLPVIMLLTAMAVIISSCSRQSELLDTIPADADVVAVADAKKLCQELGITLSDTGADIPPALKSGLFTDDRSRGVLDILGRCEASGAADISTVAVVSTDGESFMTLPVNDWEKLKSLGSPWLEWGEDTEGFHTGKIKDGMTILATGSQMWILNEDPKAPVIINKLLKAAEKHSVGKIDAIAQFLGGDKMINIAIPAQNPLEEKDSGVSPETNWTLMGIEASENSLTADMEMVAETGEAIEMEGLQPVNPAVLSYVPEECSIAVAAGFTPRFDWDIITTLTSIGGDFQTRAALSVIAPYLKSIDGTVMIAAAPANNESFSDPNPGNWNFIMMAHMSQEKIDQILGMVRTMMFSAGISPKTDKDGIMVVPQYGTSLYIGNVDGYLAVATFPFSNDHNNSLTPIFEGKDAAGMLRVPSLSAISHNAPSWGIDMKARIEGSKGNLTITLPGSEGSVLLNLMTLL